MIPLSSALRSPQAFAALATATAAIAGFTAYALVRRRLTPAQREQRRRTRLAASGRIIVGTLIDTAPQTSAGELPTALIYRYSIGGVTYERGQDISTLTEHLPDLGSSSTLFGTPVQVRYDRDNPADSIILAETWNGLWTRHPESHPGSWS